MASIRTYRRNYERYIKQYEKGATKELLKTFRKWNNQIINAEFTEDNIQNELLALIQFEDMFTTYNTIYFNIGVKHGTRVGKSINLELKQFTLVDFMRIFELDLPTFLRNELITRIQQVHSTYLDLIFNMFDQRLKDGKTLVETTKEIFEVMKSPRFYRWQAERIARTETTTAANYAAIKAGPVSGFVMEKQWISALGPRTRRTPPNDFDHREMNGKRVGLKEDFEFNPKTLNADSLGFPGDPKGSAGNTINCRCSVAVVPKRDKNGRLVRI